MQLSVFSHCAYEVNKVRGLGRPLMRNWVGRLGRPLREAKLPASRLFPSVYGLFADKDLIIPMPNLANCIRMLAFQIDAKPDLSTTGLVTLATAALDAFIRFSLSNPTSFSPAATAASTERGHVEALHVLLSCVR